MVGFIYFLWNYFEECAKKRKLEKIQKYDKNYFEEREKLLEKIL